MKIELSKGHKRNEHVIEPDSDQTVTLRDVFNGIGIETDLGRFGIAQRDGGIEILFDGELVWSSDHVQSLSALHELTRVQTSKGNWDYDEYMHGMANGMILALALFEGGEPKYLDAPKEWGKDKGERLGCEGHLLRMVGKKAVCPETEEGADGDSEKK